MDPSWDPSWDPAARAAALRDGGLEGAYRLERLGRVAATGPFAPLQRNGGYVATRKSSSLKAMGGSPAQGAQDAGGGSRLREPNADSPRECPIRATETS